MAQTQKKEIDGTVFTVTPFFAVEALRLKAHLARTFGPTLGQALGSAGGAESGVAVKLDGAAISGAVEKLTTVLDEDRFIALLKRLFAQVEVDTGGEDGRQKHFSFGEPSFDAAMTAVFTGRTFSIYPLAAFVLRVNYPDFFTLAGGFGSRLKTMFTSLPADAASNGVSGTLGI
jgi:hypothetical protein